MIDRTTQRRAYLSIASLLSLVACLALFRAANAQDPKKPSLAALKVGFEDKYRAAYWTPVEVTLMGGADSLTGQLFLSTADGDGTTSTFVYPRPIQLLPFQPAKALMYVKFGGMYSHLNVVFRVNNRDVIKETLDQNNLEGKLSMPWGINPEEGLVLSLGAPIGVEQAIELRQSETSKQTQLVFLSSVAQLPTEWYGYDGVDAVVISTAQPEMFGGLTETSARLAALEQWVEQGGTLVLVVGANAPQVLASDAPLARFAPGRFVEATTLRRTRALESFVGSRKIARRADREFALPVPRLGDIEGVVELAEGDLPLIVRTPRRFGQVVFVAIDLDRQPFVEWDGRGPLVQQLLGWKRAKTSASSTPNQPSYAGYDLTQQLRTDLDEFRNVTPIPFVWVALLILGYIALIGPGDYFLVKKLLRRMELTWVTFPLWVVLVSGSAYALARYTKGDDLRLNQIDLVDVDVATKTVRGTTWLNVFSPQSSQFEMSMLPQHQLGDAAAQHDCLMSWLSASSNLRMARGGSLFGGSYMFAADLSTMVGVPIQVWSTKGFLGRTSFDMEESLTANLTLGLDDVPQGTITSRLPIKLDQCVLVSRRWAYSLGSIKPGDTVDLNPGEQRALENILQEMPYRGGHAQFDQLPEVLLRMMFYDAIEHTDERQNNNLHHFVDLSHLLAADRAMLVGRIRQRAVQALDHGEALEGKDDQHWSVYRFILPLQKSEK